MPLHQVIILSELDSSTITQIEWNKAARLVLLTDGYISLLQTQELMTIQHQCPRLQIDIRICHHPLNFMYLLGQLSARYSAAEIWLQPSTLVAESIELVAESIEWAQDWNSNSLNTTSSTKPVSQEMDTKMKLLLERYDNTAPYDPIKYSRPINTVIDEQIVS